MSAEREPLHLILQCVNQPCICSNSQISRLQLYQSDRSEIIYKYTCIHTCTHRQAYTADQKGIWLSNMKRKTKGVIVSCLPWTPGAMAIQSSERHLRASAMAVAFMSGRNFFQRQLKAQSLILFLSPLLSPVAKRSGQCTLVSHFKGCLFFCSSEDFQISLATVPHLLYGLGVHIRS